MQPAWNQANWGIQASSAYTMPGYAAPMQAAAPIAATATTMSNMHYQVPGYQWQGYSSTQTPATAPAPAVPSAVGNWPQAQPAAGVSQPQQQSQWEQWQQWQQQYAQWQQQYGKDYMAAMQATGQTPGPMPGNVASGPPMPPAAPPVSAAPPLPPTSPPPPQPGAPKHSSNSKESESDKKSRSELDDAIQVIRNSLAEMAEAEKQFDEQFNNWESQFNSWREENANHPDTDQYQAYEAKWTSWRNQLLQRREQMKKKKDAKVSELEKAEKIAKEAQAATNLASSQIPPSSAAAPSVPGQNAMMGYGNYSMAGYNQPFNMYGGQQQFSHAPTPVGPPARLLGDTSGGNSNSAVPNLSNQSGLLAPSAQTNGTDTTGGDSLAAIAVVGSGASSSGGIPGLDLIDPNSKTSGSYPTPSMMPPVSHVSQEPMKTPADSKPFDFPQQNKGIPPGPMPPNFMAGFPGMGGMQNMGVPPPGGMGGPLGGLSGLPGGMGGPLVGMGGMGGPPGGMGVPPPNFNLGNKPFHVGSNMNHPPPGKINPNKEVVENLMNSGPFGGQNPNAEQHPQFDSRNPPPSFNDSPFNKQSPSGKNTNNQFPDRWSGNDDNSPRSNFGSQNQGPHGRNSGPPFFPNQGNFGPGPGSRPSGGPGHTDGRKPLLPTPLMSEENLRFSRPPFGGDGKEDYEPEDWQENDDNTQGLSRPGAHGPPGQRGPGPMHGGPPGGPRGQMQGAPGPNRSGSGMQGPPSRWEGQMQGPPARQGGPGMQGPPDLQGGPPGGWNGPPQGPPGPNQGGPGLQGPPGPNQGGPGMQGPPGRWNGPPGLHGPMQGPPGSMRGPGPHGPMRGPPPPFGGPNDMEGPDDKPSDDLTGNMDGSEKKGALNSSSDQGGPPNDFQRPPGQPGDSTEESSADAPKLPPVFVAEVIIDYRHQSAELGFPDLFEAESMVDYAHGANDMKDLMKSGALDPTPPSKPADAWESPHFGRGFESPDRRFPLGPPRGLMGIPPSMHGPPHLMHMPPHLMHGPPPLRGPHPMGGPPHPRGLRGGPESWSPHDDPDRLPPPPRGRDWDDRDDRPPRDHDDRRDDRREDQARRDERRREEDRRRDRSRDRSRDRDRRSPPSRWNSRDDDKRSRDRDREDRRDRGRDRERSRERDRPDRQAPLKEGPGRPQSDGPPGAELRLGPPKTFQISDLLLPPGRNARPQKLIIILRGPPGSGKSYVAKLLKDKEVEMGGSAPRILSIDDYFMVETDKEETDPESGRKVVKKAMEYEYEAGVESTYQDSLVKAFRKTVTDGYFPFIIVDSVNSKISNFEDISGFGKQKGFQVYICEMEMDAGECIKRNTHGRTEKDIVDCIKTWEKTPNDEVVLDIRSLLQEAAITDVDMEDTSEEPKPEDTPIEIKDDKDSQSDTAPPTKTPPTEGPTESNNDDQPEDQENQNEEEDEPCAESGFFSAANRSKWDDLDSSFNKLDRLDGLAKARTSTSIKDWLQLPEDYFETREQTASVLGSSKGKRVRWADLEERYEQEKMRAIGFVVGQTDWGRMMDPTGGQSKLTQTKYI